MTGVCFSAVPEAVLAFDQSLPPIADWTSRIFFASIGMAVPLSEMFDPKACYYGLLLTVLAVISKVITGVFDWDLKWAIGWAMVGRGELGKKHVFLFYF